jgi:hypothetical protein
MTMGLFACSRASSNATPAPSSSAPSPAVSVATVAPPSASVAAPVDAGPASTCFVDLEDPVASIDKVPSAVIARAIVPSLVTKTMQAKVIPSVSKDTLPTIADCLGDHADVDWGAHDPPVPPPGKVEVPLRQKLANGREAIWMITDSPVGACESHDGFVAIVHLEDRRVVADGVGQWSRHCGPPEKFHLAKLGDDTVYSEAESYGTGDGQQENEALWVLRGPRIVLIGEMDVGHEGNVDSARDWVPSMTGKSRYVGAEYIVHETWTWTLKDDATFDAGDGGARVKTRSLDRKYHLVGDTLKSEGPEGEPKMP